MSLYLLSFRQNNKVVNHKRTFVAEFLPTKPKASLVIKRLPTSRRQVSKY